MDLCSSLNHLQEDSLCLLSTTLWCIWKARNSAIFEGSPISINQVLNQAISFQHTFAIIHKSNLAFYLLISLPLNEKTTQPSQLKINVDASFKNGLGSVGMLIRDDNGTLKSAASLFLGPTNSIEIAELCAMTFGILEASKIFYEDVILESNALTCVARVNYMDQEISDLGKLADQIRYAGKNFNSCVVWDIYRSGNSPANF